MWRDIFLLLLAAAAAWTQPSALDLLEKKTLGLLEEYDDSFEGVLGVALVDITTGRRLALNGDTVFPTASLIKVPIMAAVYEAERDRQFRFSDRIGGASIAELVRAMIEKSDNAATNKLIERLGMDRINHSIRGLGLKQTLLRRIMLDTAAAKRNEENVSTPNDLSRLFEMIAAGKLVDKAASSEMLEILRRVEGGFAEGLPLDTPVAIKTGQIPGSRGESGIVYVKGRPFVLTVMSAFIDDRRAPVADIARLLYPFMEKVAASNQYGQRFP